MNDLFPSARQALLLVLALFLAEYTVGAALYDARQVLGLTGNELDALVTLLGYAVVFSVMMHLKKMRYRELFHTSGASLRATVMLLLPPIALMVPALILALTAWSGLVERLVPMSPGDVQMFERMSANNLPAVVATCLLAPVLEEMLFRGIILRAFLARYARWPAILGSAMLFAVAHMNIYQFGVAMVLGVLSGWLFERTRSLVPCIALHACYNTSLVLLQLSDTQDGDLTGSLGLWLLALAAAALGLLMLRRLLGGRASRTV